MRFIVLGNVTIDESMAAAAWPSPGQTVVVGAPRRDLGGKGANQALNLKRAGGTVRFVAAVGHDELAAWAAAQLDREGFPVDGLIRVQAPTDRSLIFVGPGGENMIASVVGSAASVTAGQAVASLAGARQGDVLILQGNLSLATTQAACVEARRLGMLTAFNPSPMRGGFEALLPLVDLLVVNQSEAVQLGVAGNETVLLRVLHEAGAGDVVLTLGGRGAQSFGRNGAHVVAATEVSVVDTTGAGDTFMGVLAAGLYARALPMRAAMQAAASAAARTVSRRGTWSAFPSAAEIATIFAGL